MTLIRDIPVANPDLSDLERSYVDEAITSTWISSTGAFLDRFESEFASACDAPHALAVSNGTVAIHLALEALGVGPGDEVIVPSLTYIATANAVKYTGATPVFVDVDRATWCIDPAQVEAAITPATVGVIPVHIYGHPADMPRLVEIAERHGLWLVEDAAEAHFATIDGRPVGSFGDAATFSFFGNKILTSGEGGAVTCRDDELARRMRQLRGQGVDPERRYWFPVIGYNYRLTNVAAALLCAQMQRREEIIGARQQVFDQYEARLTGAPGLELQRIAGNCTRAPWLFCALTALDAPITRDELMKGLRSRGIDTRPFFVPLHELPPYEGANTFGELPVTADLASRGLNLPTYGGMPEDDITYVADNLAELVAGA